MKKNLREYLIIIIALILAIPTLVSAEESRKLFDHEEEFVTTSEMHDMLADLGMLRENAYMPPLEDVKAAYQKKNNKPLPDKYANEYYIYKFVNDRSVVGSEKSMLSGEYLMKLKNFPKTGQQ